MVVDYTMIPKLHRAARRQRAEAIGRLVASAFAWIVSHNPRVSHAARPHFAR
jgi:hypothetical protein